MIKDIMASNERVSLNDRELAVLKENFPACFHADGSFDFDRFKEYLTDKVAITNEGYELRFLGKNYARLVAAMDTDTVVVPDEAHNAKPENVNSQNIYISGDNLDGLKHLLKSYARGVKCIYIDPPYNTGSDGFVYQDSYSFTVEELSEKLSIDENQAQRILDLTRRSSASHSAWLMFMYPRLLLARDLLTEDGVIFVSIDDHEQGNLKLILDDIFGEENFEGHIHWRRRSNQPNDKTKLIGIVTEHILVFSKNSQYLKQAGVGKLALTGEFANPDHDPRGPWASKPWKSGSDQSGTRYIITTPTGVTLDEEWMGDYDSYCALLADDRIIFPRGGDGMPRKKYFKSEREAEGQCACNWWPHEIYGNNQEASAELEALFGFKNAFSNPKPSRLIDSILDLGNVKEGDLVLDFFSGSATTAEAVMKRSIHTKCQFILVQLPENIDSLLLRANASEKEKWAQIVKMLDSNKRPHTLDQIGMERIIRAAMKIRGQVPNPPADLGFQHFVLSKPSGTALDQILSFSPDDNGMFENSTILDEFGIPTVLATWLVRDGYGFTPSVRAICFDGYTAYHMDKHLYLIAPKLSEGAISAIIAKLESDGAFNPENVVLFGYSFTWTELEALKINLMRLRDTEKNLRINFDIRY